MSRPVSPLVLISLWVAETLSSFETSMILAALKVLVAEFGDPALVGWLVTGFLIVGAASAAVVGRLGDIYGRRKVLLIVLVLGFIGSVMSALADGFALLLAGRLLQGVTATILPLGIGLIRETRTPDKVPMAIGFFMSGATIGTAAGLVLGGLVVDNFTWHGIFMISAALCVIAFIMVRAFVPRSTPLPDSRRIDWFSGILFAPGVTLLLLYLNGGKAWGWGSPGALALLAGGLVLCAWWWVASRRSDNPLIDVRPLADRAIAVSCATSAFVAMGALQVTVYFSLLLQAPTWTIAGLGLSATAAGLAKLPSNMTSVLAGPLGGWLTGRGGGRIAMLIGGVVTTIGWTLALFDTSSVPIVIATLIVISFGTTMLFAVTPTIIAAAAPPERTSEVSGMVGVIRALFMGVGAQIVTFLLATETVTRGSESYPSPDAFRFALIAIIVLTVIATALSLLLPRKVGAARS